MHIFYSCKKFTVVIVQRWRLINETRSRRSEVRVRERVWQIISKMNFSFDHVWPVINENILNKVLWVTVNHLGGGGRHVWLLYATARIRSWPYRTQQKRTMTLSYKENFLRKILLQFCLCIIVPWCFQQTFRWILLIMEKSYKIWTRIIRLEMTPSTTGPLTRSINCKSLINKRKVATEFKGFVVNEAIRTTRSAQRCIAPSTLNLNFRFFGKCFETLLALNEDKDLRRQDLGQVIKFYCLCRSKQHTHFLSLSSTIFSYPLPLSFTHTFTQIFGNSIKKTVADVVSFFFPTRVFMSLSFLSYYSLCVCILIYLSLLSFILLYHSPSLSWKLHCQSPAVSVTRFGEISPIGQDFRSLR